MTRVTRSPATSRTNAACGATVTATIGFAWAPARNGAPLVANKANKSIPAAKPRMLAFGFLIHVLQSPDLVIITIITLPSEAKDVNRLLRNILRMPKAKMCTRAGYGSIHPPYSSTSNGYVPDSEVRQNTGSTGPTSGRRPASARNRGIHPLAHANRQHLRIAAGEIKPVAGLIPEQPQHFFGQLDR